MPDMDDVRKFIGRKNLLIEDLNEQLQEAVSKAQGQFISDILEDIAAQLDTDRGRIENTSRNRKLLTKIDTVMNNFASGDGLKIVNSMIKGTESIVTLNSQYFTVFAGQAKVVPIQARAINDVKLWLGMDDKNRLKENGYLRKLLTAGEMRTEVQQFTLKGISTQQGYDSFKKSLKAYVGDNKTRAGRFQQYYRNYAYDTYSQIDRTVSSQMADDLGMTYAIYEGGIIADSRKFCRARNGKVFTRDEIMKFNPTEAKPPNYNPITDLGGYGCRHHLNWISYELAVRLRPDLKRD